MSDTIEREITLEAPPERVWEVITSPGWLAEDVALELTPGGEATFRSGAEVRRGWVEDAAAPSRLVFWWAAGDEPASRVELRLEPADPGTRLHVLETRPLDVLDLVGLPIYRPGGRTHGPALVAS